MSVSRETIRMLAPSDLSYLYDRCPCCYWLKLHGFRGPDEKLPGVFRDIDRYQKAGVTIETLRGLGIKAVEFLPKLRVRSKPAEFGGSVLCVSGETDRRVRLEDGTVGIIDFKTSKPRTENMARFKRAMNAYEFAVEQGDESQDEVSLLALVVFNPLEFKLRDGHATECYYMGQHLRINVESDQAWFTETFLPGIGRMLAKAELPEPGRNCDVCRHADQVVNMRMNQLLYQVSIHPELGPEVAAKLGAHIRL